jgi:ribonuclease HII
MTAAFGKTRRKLGPIIERTNSCFSVSHLEPNVIDEINILNASIKAMQECVLKLEPQPVYIVDGNTPFIHKME